MTSKIPTLLTLKQFADRHPGFTVPQLRWLRFRSEPVQRTGRGSAPDRPVEDLPANGFAACFVRVGGRVYIDEPRFFEIIELQNSKTRQAG